MNKNLDNEVKYIECMRKHEEKSKRALQRLGIIDYYKIMELCIGNRRHMNVSIMKPTRKKMKRISRDANLKQIEN